MCWFVVCWFVVCFFHTHRFRIVGTKNNTSVRCKHKHKQHKQKQSNSMAQRRALLHVLNNTRQHGLCMASLEQLGSTPMLSLMGCHQLQPSRGFVPGRNDYTLMQAKPPTNWGLRYAAVCVGVLYGIVPSKLQGFTFISCTGLCLRRLPM